MASLADVLTTAQQGVQAANALVKQMTGSFNNIAAQLAALQANPYKIIQLTRVMSVATGNVSYTGVGFKPRLILFQTAIIGGSGWSSQGEADGIVNTCTEVANTASFTGSFYQNFAGIQREDTVGNNYQTFTLLSFDTNGFTLSYVKNGTPVSTASINATCFR